MVSAVEKAETDAMETSVEWKESSWWPARSYTAEDRWKKVEKVDVKARPSSAASSAEDRGKFCKVGVKTRPPSAAASAEMEWRKKLDAANDAGFDSVLKHELCTAKLTLSAMKAKVYRKKMSLVSRLLSEHLCAVSWVSFDALRNFWSEFEAACAMFGISDVHLDEWCERAVGNHL